MVETVSKSGKDLVDAINKVKNDVFNHGNIVLFNRGINYLNDDIKANVSPELYDDFRTEKRCVYYESLYGDGEYTKHVIDDCVSVLDEIIESIAVV